MNERESFQVDSYRLLEWVNLITTIHNQMAQVKPFDAGFNLCFLQQCIFNCYKDLEIQEKQSREPL